MGDALLSSPNALFCKPIKMQSRNNLQINILCFLHPSYQCALSGLQSAVPSASSGFRTRSLTHAVTYSFIHSSSIYEGLLRAGLCPDSEDPEMNKAQRQHRIVGVWNQKNVGVFLYSCFFVFFIQALPFSSCMTLASC